MSTIENTAFTFDYFRYNGKGNKPSLVPTVDQANFIRSRFSIEESMLDVAVQRVTDWARQRGTPLPWHHEFSAKLFFSPLVSFSQDPGC